MPGTTARLTRAVTRTIPRASTALVVACTDARGRAVALAKTDGARQSKGEQQ